MLWTPSVFDTEGALWRERVVIPIHWELALVFSDGSTIDLSVLGLNELQMSTVKSRMSTSVFLYLAWASRTSWSGSDVDLYWVKIKVWVRFICAWIPVSKEKYRNDFWTLVSGVTGLPSFISCLIARVWFCDRCHVGLHHRFRWPLLAMSDTR